MVFYSSYTLLKRMVPFSPLFVMLRIGASGFKRLKDFPLVAVTMLFFCTSVECLLTDDH